MTQMKALGEFETIAAAREYPAVRGHILNSNDIGAIMSEHRGTLNAIKDAAQRSEELEIFLTRFRSDGRFDFIETSPVGEKLLKQLESMVGVVISQDFFKAVKAEANESYRPYKNISEYEWACARNIDLAAKKKPISKIEDGFACIETTSDCEKHNPQIYQLVNGVHVRRASFLSVEKAGKYQVVVPSGVTLYVDDYYGVM